MLTHRIIPCLDVHGGRVVKGVNFVNLQDAGDPVDIARAYDQAGADELVFLDITASHEQRDIMLDVVRQVAEQCFMPFTVGGGIRTITDVTRLIQAGAEKVSINTAAVVSPDIVAQTARRFGSCATVINIDPKRVPAAQFLDDFRASGRPEPDDGGWRMADGGWLPTAALSDPSSIIHRPSPIIFEVHTHGGRKPTGLEAVAYARHVVELGAGEIVLTSMDADGTKDGYDIEITKLIADAVDVPVVASGGCGSPQHMVDVLQQTRADAVLAASIFHYGQYSIAQTKQVLAEAGLPVRLT
ncbi:MAG: imidazole glycerol phosphate synthase subunit HisF [Phycisphaeraceae bacterium]|nr:imidazole glycerol phosphate synthase subunit HisF [Phycisphaeraceae bacterium]